MGSLAPLSSWIPEDDLLLKNSIEAGASLESLAKGAVRFSRRFTIRELQDRWHSLLYDPEISAEASELMMEFERSTSNLASKSSKVESSKEGKGTQKRKVESVRRCYYAMRKRICNDPLNQGDLNFLAAPAQNFYQNGNEAVGCDILGDPMDNHFELGNSNFDDLHHVFPQDVRNSIDGASHESDNGDWGNLEQHQICEQIPHVFEHNMSLGGNCAAVGGINSSEEIHVQNGLAENLDANPLSNGNDNMNPGLEGGHVFNSPISECEASFQHLQYSSPPPAMPVWQNMDSMSAMEMAGDSQLRGKSPPTGDAFGLPDDAMEMPSEYGIVHSDTEFQNHMVACAELKTSSSCPQFDLVALSDTLLNLSDDDEMLLMDDDGKEIDKYGLSNLLLDSPADVYADQNQILNVSEVDASIAPESDLHNPSSAATVQQGQGGNDLDTSTAQNPSSSSGITPQLSELCEAVICCTLNTEDLEVPCNDHVIFPSKSHLESFSRGGLNEVRHPALSVKDISHKQPSETGLSLLNKEMKRFGELHAASQARGHGTGFNHAVAECNAKLESPRTENISKNSKHLGTASCNTLVSKEVVPEIVSNKQSCPDPPDLPVKVSDGLNSHFESHSLGIKQEGQVLPAIKKLEALTELVITDEMAPEPVGEPFLSDLEEQLSDIDDDDADIPYCSDIESMILDMDLGPEDLESYSYREVAMYQSEDAKRAIIRLEQGARAYMQRDIASHGAFAVLYGHNSKHYIKKPEILLGRATEDTIVDIDLGKEGRANKISRRQAIIRLDEDGTFHLRNLGKSSVSVDNKEIYPGQSLALPSDCLIEIREIPFIFEYNKARVKQYLTMPPNEAKIRLLLI